MRLLALVLGVALGYAVGRLWREGMTQPARFDYRYPQTWTSPSYSVTYGGIQ